MRYAEFIQKAKDIALVIDHDQKYCYITPDYRYLMNLAGLNLEDVEDFPGVSYGIVAENLRLEVEQYNAMNNPMPYLASLLKDILDYQISPIVEQENNELMLNMLEYIRAKNPPQEKQDPSLYDEYMDFSKKEV